MNSNLSLPSTAFYTLLVTLAKSFLERGFEKFLFKKFQMVILQFFQIFIPSKILNYKLC